jgi:hypothetical protein
LFFDHRFWLICKRIYLNYKEIKKFYIIKKDVEIIEFEIPTEILFSHIKYEIFKTVSNLIENAKKYDLYEIDKNINFYFKTEWPENLNELKLLLKLIWLIKNLKKTKVKNPFQLLCCGDHYMIHPGTTRLLVSCYILPSKTIKGFYIWDKKMDSDPFILNYRHKKIKNPLSLLLKFSFTAPFRIKHLILNEKTDCSDKLEREESDRIFQMAQKCFLKYNNTFETPFLTFHQSIHWEKIKKGFLFQDNIKFQGNYCFIDNIKFEKINDYWLKVD